MIRALVVTWWIGDGATEATAWRSHLRPADPALERVVPVSVGTDNPIPDPNILLVECLLTEESLDALRADPDYGPEAILWEEPVA